MRLIGNRSLRRCAPLIRESVQVAASGSLKQHGDGAWSPERNRAPPIFVRFDNILKRAVKCSHRRLVARPSRGKPPRFADTLDDALDVALNDTMGDTVQYTVGDAAPNTLSVLSRLSPCID